MILAPPQTPYKAPASVKRLVQQHPLIAYFVVAYTISWLLWLPLVAAAHGLLPPGAVSYFHLLGSLGPLVAAILITASCEPKAGLRALLARMGRWRVGVVWWMMALLGPAALYGLAAILLRLSSGAWPEMSGFGQSADYPELGLLLFWVVNILCYGFGEETGWRGFALPRLQYKHSAFVASLILSVFWAGWHIPLFFSLKSFMQMGLGGTIGWAVFMVLGSFLPTWVYNSTRGSILVVAVFHGTLDIVSNSPSPGALTSATGALFTLVSLLVLLVAGPAYLSRIGKHVIGAEAPLGTMVRQKKAGIPWQKLYNPLVIWLLCSPLHRLLGQQMMLLTVTGRKSGKPYTLPVSPIREGDTWLVLSQKDRTWWKNLQGGAPLLVMLHRQTLQARGEACTDAATVAPQLLSLLQRHPRSQRLLHLRLDAMGHPEHPEALEQLAKDTVLVRISPIADRAA